MKSISVINKKQSTIAFCYSTKDRTDLSLQTIQPILDEKGFDLYWIDGSSGAEGQALPDSYIKCRNLCEIHKGVTGGADVAILYNLSLLLDRGYQYIGLIENDVLLEAGWFEKTIALFETGKQEGLKVGSVSSRSYVPRIHVPRGDYALMRNVGAGMVLFTREAVEKVLSNFHTGTFGEPSFIFSHYTGVNGVVPWQMNVPPQQQACKMQTCSDWFFEASILPYGMVCLALTPSMAKNVDTAPEDPIQDSISEIDPNFDWKGLCYRIQRQEVETVDDIVKVTLPHYDPVFKEWRAFPHQIIKSLPDAFQNGWKLKWSMYQGPFAFVSKQNGSSIQIPLNGMGLRILYEANGEAGEFFMETNYGKGSVKYEDKEGWQLLSLTAPDSGPHQVKIICDRPGVKIALFGFEGPQAWFKSRYNLRYKDLEAYLGDS